MILKRFLNDGTKKVPVMALKSLERFRTVGIKNVPQ